MKEAIGIAIQVAQGIEAAHEQHIIHRDIKPQNMLISMDGKVKVADFGIARAVSSQTMNATVVGSVHYISPEQARGGYSDTRSDIYSLGITMYEMVTGRVPFEGDNTVTVALAHLEEPIRLPSEINPEVPVSLEKIILKCTEKKAEYRYSSMGEVIRDLRRALIEPDGDFVEAVPRADATAKTVTISPEELSQIRQGSRNRRAEEENQPEIGRKVVPEGSPSEEEPSGEPEESLPERKGKKRPRREREEPPRNEDVSPQLERLLTGLGIFVAVIFVVGVILVLVAGWEASLNLGSGGRESQEPGEHNGAETGGDRWKEEDGTMVRMPSVTGLTMDEAEDRLAEYNLIPEWEEVYDDTAQKDTVISQDPAEGGRRWNGYSRVRS